VGRRKRVESAIATRPSARSERRQCSISRARRFLRLIGQGAWPRYGVGIGCRTDDFLSTPRLRTYQPFSANKKMYMSDENTRTLSPSASPNGDDYRRLAGEIRKVAARTRLPVARRELAQFAAKYERQADQLARR
jgi:hypothetical protein